MAVQNREQIGWINCPMCNTRGTVHQCAVGRGSRAQAKYWRCECGTIQPWKPQGQRYIAEHMQPMAPPPTESPEKPREPEHSADPNPPTEPPPKPKKRGFLDFLLEDDDE